MNTNNTELLSVKDRIIFFINSKNLSQRKFEILTNLSNGYINNIKNSISEKKFEDNIKPVFPELNKMWLLHGEGQMLIGEESQTKEAPFPELPIDQKLNKINSHLENVLRNQKELFFINQFIVNEFEEQFNIEAENEELKKIHTIFKNQLG